MHVNWRGTDIQASEALTMGKIEPNKAGLVLGALLGGWHLLWALLVALGVAQPLIDFLFWIHFIKPIYVIEPFAFRLAAILVLVTAAIGYVTGIALAMLWNRVQR
jgi:hypothetical protein